MPEFERMVAANESVWNGKEGVFDCAVQDKDVLVARVPSTLTLEEDLSRELLADERMWKILEATCPHSTSGFFESYTVHQFEKDDDTVKWMLESFIANAPPFCYDIKCTESVYAGVQEHFTRFYVMFSPFLSIVVLVGMQQVYQILASRAHSAGKISPEKEK